MQRKHDRVKETVKGHILSNRSLVTSKSVNGRKVNLLPSMVSSSQCVGSFVDGSGTSFQAS